MKKFRIRKIYTVMILTSLVIVGFVIFADQFFRTKKIVIHPLNESSTRQTTNLTGLTSLYNSNLILLSSNGVKENILNNNPQVQSVHIEKKYPDTLNISVGFYNPAAYIQVNGGYFLLSQSGKILEKNKTIQNKNIPTIKYYQQLDYYGYQSGDVISFKDIAASLKLLVKSLDLGLIINNIDINGLNMIVLNSKDKRFIFTTEKEISEQEYQFAEIVRKLRIEGREFKSLDLRFNKPVISL